MQAMATDAVVRARIDSRTKEEASAALEAMGLSVSDAIRLLMMRIAEERRLPFEVRVAKPSTAKAVKELDEGKGERFTDADALFKDLGI
jgi:DNA-damage-inducible protein J